MRFSVILLLFVAVASACTSPRQDKVDESIVSDSVSGTPPKKVFYPMSLLPAEKERLKEELYFYCHENFAGFSGAKLAERFEGFTLKDSGFVYTAVVLLTTDSDYPRQYREGDIDTVEVEGQISIEEMVKTKAEYYDSFVARIEGSRILSGLFYPEYSEGYYDSQLYTFSESVPVDVTAPRKYTRDQLYLKARFTALTDEDLENFTLDDLGYMRNEIFARHGHIFKTDKMAAYFLKQLWYEARVFDASGFLNNIEKKNVEFIKAKEKGI